MAALENFYKSREWQRFREVLIAERTNADGYIICAHCGMPILQKYDCIAHHWKTFLTEENVNDYNVSMNPDNVQLVHHACHNRVHDKLGYTRKEIYLVYGPPLSGVAEYARDNASPGDLVVDMDSIWECISGQPRYVHPGRLNAVAFGVRDYLLDCVRVKRGKWNNAYIAGGFPLISERERLIRETGARVVFIDKTIDECMTELEQRSDIQDKEIYRSYIEDWFRKHGRDPEI